MEYSLNIRDTNIPAHLDIEREIMDKKTGQITFTIRVNNGNIVDLALVEYVDVRDYLRLKSFTISQFTITHHTGNGNSQDAIRNSDGQF